MATDVVPGQMATPTSSELNTEVGVQLRGMPFTEVFASGKYTLIRESEPTVAQLVEMRRNDGQARGLFRLLTMPVRAAASRMTWIPADGDKGEATFAENLLTTPAVSGGMLVSFSKVISQMLLAVFDGFSPFELVYTVPKRGPLQGKFSLLKVAYRPSETVQFLVDENGIYNGIRQRTAAPGGRYLDVEIDENHSLYYACSDEENPFYGVSYFNAAFYHYDKKIKLYYLAHLSAQHRAVGSRLGKYPPGASPKEIMEFRKGLADFGLAQAMSVPDKGYTVEDLGKSLGDFPFMDFINHHNSQMSKSVLAPFFDDAQGGQKSMVDFGGQSDSMYQTLINVLISELESLLNDTLIPRFIDWNFGSHNYPSVKFGAFNEDQKIAIHDTFNKLVIAGPAANTTRPFMLELEKYMAGELGLDIDYTQITKALAKMEKDSLAHFMSGATPPPPVRPFQPIGTNPADQQQGVPGNQQWMPGPQPAAPRVPGAPPGPSAGSPAPAAGGSFPALPSQLSADMTDAVALTDVSLSDSDEDFVAASVVYIKPYSRVLHDGRLNFVKGYYLNTETHQIIPSSEVPKGEIKTVSAESVAKVVSKVQDVKSATGGSGKASDLSPGKYAIHLPDGSVSSLVLKADGSGVATHLGKSEAVTSDLARKFLAHWNASGKVDKPASEKSATDVAKAGEHDVAKAGEHDISHEHIKSGIRLLQGEKSTSVKAPLKAAGHPLADVDLRKVADAHAGTKLHYSKLREGVISALQSHLDEHSAGVSSIPPSKPRTPVPSSHNVARAGMHVATQEDHAQLAKRGIKLPPAWKDVHVSDDPKASLVAIGKDVKGRSQYVYSAEHSETQSAAKFARINALRPHIAEVDKRLSEDSTKSDAAAALMLIRRLGLRPGSETDTGAEKKAHGATNLRAEHVKVHGDNVHLDFVGKKGVPLSFSVKDAQLAAVIAPRLKGKKAGDQIFDTDEKKTSAYFHGIAPGFKLKDLRTYYGTISAFDAVDKMPVPSTKAEFAKARKAVAEQVSARLGNTPTIALASYIDPAVFAPWEDELRKK